MALRVDASVRQYFDELLSQLRSARRAAELPQRLLAPQLQVTITSLADWEAGRDDPTMIHLLRWADALGFRLVIVDPRGSPGPSAGRSDEGEPWENCEMRRLAAALRARRRSCDMSQETLAALVGVSRISMQRWESVQVFPRPIAFLVWAGALECTAALRTSDLDAAPASTRDHTASASHATGQRDP